MKFSIGCMLFFVPLLSGCDSEEEFSEPEPIVLNCYDDKDKGTDQEGYYSTLRIYPNNPYQNSIHYFNFDEKRWTSDCESKFSTCELTVGPRFISEVGTVGQSKVITEINRTTGRISQTAYWNSLNPEEYWNGDCETAPEPEESETKF